MRKGAIVSLLFFVLVFGLWLLSRSHTVQLFGDIDARVEMRAPLVALTFDDGPSVKYTGKLIDILAAHNARATFFVTGREAQKNQEQMRALVAAGHDIGNHAYSHRRMVLMSPATVRRELASTDAAIRSAGYKRPIPFRPPYGKKLFVLPWIVSQENRLTVMWDVEPDSDLSASSDTIAASAVQDAKPGSIILLHGMYDSREATRGAIGKIIEGLRAKGLEPVTLTELLAERTVR